MEFKEVHILPANDDGTIFTVNTGSMQKNADNLEPISTYSFRNGALVPVYTDEQSDTEPVLYTIENDDIKPVPYQQSSGHSNSYLFVDPNRSEQVPDSYEIVLNDNSENSQTLYEGKSQIAHSPIIMEYPSKNYVGNQIKSSSQDAMEVVYITERKETTRSPPVIVKTEVDAVTIEPIASKNIKPNPDYEPSSITVKKK
ncbi:hypothetical protein Trydic_g10021 [Trypoxylus dichotomus]